MKTRLFSISVALLGLIGSSVAQNTIELDITHTLNDDNFAFYQGTTTPENVKFDVKRTQYYLSGFSVVHDGGMVTSFDSVWALVNASQPTTITIGDAMIDSVEAVRFAVGVEQAFNHLDPTIWPFNHPLALQNPSMHWGWASGYRFVAIEGNGGDNYDQLFEIHTLGNENYHQTSVEVGAVADAGVITIPIYANIAMALKGIDVSEGFILHSSAAGAITVMNNFRDYVFTAEMYVDTTDNDDGDTTNAVTELYTSSPVKVISNPSVDNSISLLIENLNSGDVSVSVVNASGQVVSSTQNIKTNGIHRIEGMSAGFYFVEVKDRNGVRLDLLKAIVQ